MRRIRGRLAMTLIAAAAIAPITGASPVAAASDLLPDLKMAPMYDFVIQRGRNGKVKLRFGAIVWNIGQGPLEVRGSGRERRKMTILKQVLKRSDGGTRTIAGPPGITAWYSKDGHDHWHIANFVIVSLYPVPANPSDPPPTTARHLRKVGFCLTDLVRVPEALRPPNSGKRGYPYTGCGNSESTRFKMGISVGWGDDYKRWFAHQSVDITGLSSGNYRVCATTNSGGAWLESIVTNNSGWTDVKIDLAKDEVTILARGETECQPGTSAPSAVAIGRTRGVYGGVRPN